MEIPKITGVTENAPYISAGTLGESEKKKKARSFFNYAGILIGIVILFVAVVALTTDITIGNIFDIASLGLSFFVLALCTYLMYVSCADSGMRAGFISDPYLAITSIYDELKQKIIDSGRQSRLQDFCREYIREEMKNTRTSILSEACVDYDIYAEKYLGTDASVIDADESLTVIQKKVIKRANKVRPIKLSPDMIIRRGNARSSRVPLCISPERKRRIAFTTKFGRTFIISAVMVCMNFEVMISPNWATFAAISLKLMTVLISGFMGYKFGYENVVIDTVEYIGCQSDLMREYLKFAKDEKG